MAEETILIVEDTPVSLKLSAVVLRAEGYKVHVASTAEQALMSLKTVRPDLILLDIRLPGISGLELTSLIKQDPAHKDATVIALTSLNTPADEQRARDAGCDGYLTKPIDTRTLAESVRHFLDHGASQVVGIDDGPVTQVEQGLALPELLLHDVRLTFLIEGTLESSRFQVTPLNQMDQAFVARRLLQWATTGNLLELGAVSVRAKEAEALLRHPDTTAAQATVAFTKLARAFADAARANPCDNPPPFVMEKLSGKRVALVAVADAEADLLCTALGRAGAKPRLFDGTEPPASESLCGCPVGLVHVRPETHWLPWLQSDFDPPTGMTILWIGRRQHIMALDPQVLGRARDALIDFWQPAEALLRIYMALTTPSKPERSELADESPDTLEIGR